MITPAKPTEEDYMEGEEISNENMLCKLSLQCRVTRKHYDQMGNSSVRWNHANLNNLVKGDIYIYPHIYMGFPGGSDGKEFAYNKGDPDSIPGLERSPGEGNGYLIQYSGLENSMDKGPGGLQSMKLQRAGHD